MDVDLLGLPILRIRRFHFSVGAIPCHPLCAATATTTHPPSKSCTHSPVLDKTLDEDEIIPPRCRVAGRAAGVFDQRLNGVVPPCRRHAMFEPRFQLAKLLAACSVILRAVAVDTHGVATQLAATCICSALPHLNIACPKPAHR